MIAKEMKPDALATSGDRTKAQSCLVINGSAWGDRMGHAKSCARAMVDGARGGNRAK